MATKRIATPPPSMVVASAVDLAVLSTTVEHIKEDQTDIKVSLAGINDSLKVMGRVEERQLNVVRDVSALATNKDALDKRVTSIESEMPGFREMRQWVIRGITAGIAMIFAGTIAIVGAVFVDRFIQKPPQQVVIVPAA